MIFVVSACSWHAAAPVAPLERIDAFAITSRGQSMMGQALVVSDEDTVTLHALTPAGTALFSVDVTEDVATVDSPQADLATWLDRIPFARDLSVLYRYRCDDRCRAADWRLVQTPEGLKVRGPGGRALVVHDGLRWTLTDHRRGYTLIVAEGAE